LNRWDHIFLTTLVFVIVWLVVQRFMPWLFPPFFGFMFLLVAWLGGIFPDFDSDWSPLLGHRSFVTHSVIAPLAFMAISVVGLHLIGWWVFLDWYFVEVFLFSCGWHLWLDLFSSSTSVLNRFLKEPLKGLPITKGVPGNITKVPEKMERPWLILNGLTLILIASFLWIMTLLAP